MGRFLLAVAACLLCHGAFADMLGPSPVFTKLATSPSTAAPSYIGPGDVVAGAVFWHGTYAYSSATRGTAAYNVCNVSDVVCVDMLTDASTGLLVVTTVGGTTCTSTNCTVKTAYNQANGNVNNATQATIGTRPTLLASGCGLGSLPCLAFNATQYLVTQSAIVANTPQTIIGGAYETSTSSHAGVIIRDVGGMALLRFGGSSSQTLFGFSNGSGLSGTGVTDNAWHTVEAVLNGASSFVYSDGVGLVGGSTGAGNLNATIGIGDGPGDTGDGLLGRMCSSGLWPSAISSTNSATLHTNTKTFCGY